MREIVNVITKNKFAPDAADLFQMLKSTRSQRANYVEDTGSVNALSVALDPPLGAYTIGLPLKVRIRETSTGGSTIDAGAGRVPIKLMNGASTGAGDLPAGGICELVFDGSAFQLVNFFGLGGTEEGDTTEFLIKIPYTVDSSPTPNIVVANFTPPIETLSAGDPFLVKIANTCTGASVIRINSPTGAHADKAIKANGGGNAPLLQGDLTVGDVVLFLYDGTEFWIQPNPLISANVTINVPAQYSTVENALLAIRRKIIAANATVEVLIAKTPVNPATGTNTIAPFSVNHGNADRIVIRGVMKIAGNLHGSMFAQTGNSPAARAADSNNNIAMLRARFGVEVVVTPTNVQGIQNLSGSGMPLIKDILITGPNYWSGNGIGLFMGVSLADARSITCHNVSTWGLDIGFYGGGSIFCNYCFACGCFRNGYMITGAGCILGMGYSGSFGNYGGVSANQMAGVYSYYAWSNWNSQQGVVCGDMGQTTWHTSQAIGNGYIDLMCGAVSYMIVLNSNAGGGFGTISPEPGYLSAYGGFITVVY